LDFQDIADNNVAWVNDFFLSVSSACNLLTALIESIELKELVFLLVIVVGTNKHDNEDCQED
jgi:hypothetical protein